MRESTKPVNTNRYRDTGEKIMQFEELINIMTYLGYLVVDRDGHRTQQARDVAHTLSQQNLIYGPMLPTFIGKEWNLWKENNNVSVLDSVG